MSKFEPTRSQLLALVSPPDDPPIRSMCRMGLSTASLKVKVTVCVATGVARNSRLDDAAIDDVGTVAKLSFQKLVVFIVPLTTPVKATDEVAVTVTPFEVVDVCGDVVVQVDVFAAFADGESAPTNNAALAISVPMRKPPTNGTMLLAVLWLVFVLTNERTLMSLKSLPHPLLAARWTRDI